MKLIHDDRHQIEWNGQIVLTHDELDKAWFHACRLMARNICPDFMTIQAIQGYAGDLLAKAVCDMYPERFQLNNVNAHGDVLVKGTDLILEFKSRTLACKEWGVKGIDKVKAYNYYGPSAHHQNNVGPNIIIIHVQYDFYYTLPTIMSIFVIKDLKRCDWGDDIAIGTGYTKIDDWVLMKKMKVLAVVDEQEYIDTFQNVLGYDMSFTKKQDKYTIYMASIRSHLEAGYNEYRNKGGKVGRKVGYRKDDEQYLEQYKMEIEYLKTGMSLRNCSHITGTSINTLRKLKSAFICENEMTKTSDTPLFCIF